MAGGDEDVENRGVDGTASQRRGATWTRAVVGLLVWGALACPAAAQESPPELALDPEGEDWLDDQRIAVELQLGGITARFDQFFGDDRNMDADAPSSRLRFRTWVRTAADRDFAMGGSLGTSIHLPRLEHWLGNARLVLVGEKPPDGVPPPPAGQDLSGATSAQAPAGAPSVAFLSRGRGNAELRFDLLRRPLVILDSGAGVTLAWPLIPFTRLRAHFRVGLGGEVFLRATEAVFVEFWGRGLGTGTDLEVGRLLTPFLRLRWEGHGVFAQRTRGIEWSTLIGGDWLVHPRTGLFAGGGCSGIGTPHPGLDLWRVWTGVRQDVWNGWVFMGLEPEMTWPRLAGMARTAVWAVTLRLEVVIASRPTQAGARE
jgi:hypothetical protein